MWHRDRSGHPCFRRCFLPAAVFVFGVCSPFTTVSGFGVPDANDTPLPTVWLLEVVPYSASCGTLTAAALVVVLLPCVAWSFDTSPFSHEDGAVSSARPTRTALVIGAYLGATRKDSLCSQSLSPSLSVIVTMIDRWIYE